MKTLWLRIVICLMLALSLSACRNSAEDEIQVSLNTVFKLTPGQTARLGNENLKIQFLEVENDSRCPSGVVCIQAGEAVCRMLITQNGNEHEARWAVSADTVIESIDGFRIAVQLDPYPQAGVSTDFKNYYLTLQILQ